MTGSLTDGIDGVVGANGNDIIQGYLDGTDDTLQVFDVIDGGAGIDTLSVMIADSVSTTIAETVAVENLSLKLTDTAANGTVTLDMTLVDGLQNVAVSMLSPDADGELNLNNLEADLDVISITGKDNDANSGSSDFDLYVNTSDATQLSVGTLSLNNLEGSVSVDIENLTNIPVLSLTNISLNDSGDISLVVKDTVGTGSDDTLVINATNAGAMNFVDWEEVDISLFNETGDGVIENLTITTAGTRGSSLSIDGTTSLENVTVSGSGDLALWLSDSNEVSVFDASGLAGDLSSELSNTVDATITLGAGNSWFGIDAYDTDTTDTNVVTTDLEAGAGSDWIDIGGGMSDGMVINVDTGAGNDWVDLNTAGNTETITLGAGDDIFRLNATLDNADDTVAGGDGVDMLILDAAELTADNGAALTGFEILIADGSGTYDLDHLSGITTLVAGAIDQYGYGPDAWWDPEETVDYWDVTGNSDVLFDNVAAGVALVLNYNNNQTVEVDLKTDGAANTLLVTIGNETSDVSIGGATTDGLIANDIETLTINSTGWDGDTNDTISDNTIVNLSATDMTKLVVTGASNLTITNLDTGAADTAALAQIDASAFTGNLVFGEASNTTSAMQVQLGSGDDVYSGTMLGDTINAGAGADTIALGATAETDTLIFEAGDSGIGSMDLITNFISGEDTIDLGAFGFTGTLGSAIIAKGDLDPVANYDADTSITDFFVSAGVQRGVAYATDGMDTHVFVDANGDGDFTSAADLVIQLTGTATVTLADFGF